MKILALETSAVACSVCLCEDEAILAQTYQNSGLTHSRTLLPMVRNLLDDSGHTLEEVYEKTAKDTYFEAEEAVAWGLADCVAHEI